MGRGGIAAGPSTDPGADGTVPQDGAREPLPDVPDGATVYGYPRPSAGPRLRLTRRGRQAVLGAALVLVLLVGTAAVRVVGWPDAWLPGLLGGPSCSVTTADGERRLEPEEAKRLTSAALAKTLPVGLPAADRAVVTALRTRDGALSCTVSAAERRSRDDLAREDETASGLTPRAEGVRTALRGAAGKLALGGFEPGGVSTGHMPGSAHYEGRAVDVFFRPVSAQTSRRGWLVAQWLVAHADELDVDNVIFDDRIWTASRSSAGWRPYVPPQGPTRNAVLRHLDHVHVDVARGT
ncbi:hypothetical protein [Kineosporia sp. R_H_3]|uniref:hypothetical protein n=1 Tax=Kineosporia sp. R_H_3 TaxID=1961848 RepID=UPI000B4BA2DB|nr:hypothetical protein [Kineosporia sp. R_H_3]